MGKALTGHRDRHQPEQQPPTVDRLSDTVPGVWK
jgi:hypothetical protein